MQEWDLLFRLTRSNQVSSAEAREQAGPLENDVEMVRLPNMSFFLSFLVVDTLIADGKVVRAVLGISYLESKQARALGINAGVLVLEVPENSPAALAGLKGTRRTETGLIEIGDIILKVEDNVINTESDLFAALEDRKPGEKVQVTVGRAVASENELVLKEISLTLTLQPSTIYEQKRPDVILSTP